MKVIEVNKLMKKFANRVACNDISFHLKTGEILGVIGPSGAGKSTIVKSIMGMESYDEGTIRILDTPMPNRQIMLKVGYMGQSDALYLSLTARENLVFFGKLMKLKKKELQDRISYLAAFLGLNTELDKIVSAYSGGMKRRLSLAIAMIQKPSILILDEPTVGIDPILREAIWEELIHVRNANQSIIITTHAMDEAEKCDRLLLIRNGEIIAQGTPNDLKVSYKVNSIEQVFIKAGEQFV